MDTELVCWHCGTLLDDVPLPMARAAECPHCRRELHVCRMCRFHDLTVANQCREPVAEPVKDKDRANFCGYFEPDAGAFARDGGEGQGNAGEELAALFGDDQALENSDHRQDDETNAEARARAELDALFKSSD